MNNWLGAVGFSNGFVVFSSAVYGLRAVMVLVLIGNYIARGGTNTLYKIITRYAPPSENDTDAYVTNVSFWSGIDPNSYVTRNEVSQR